MSRAPDILVHDETNKTIAQLLIDMPFGSFPIALGVIYCDPAPAFDAAVIEQNPKVAAGKKRDLNALAAQGRYLVRRAPLADARGHPG